jgi:hypothetical protein
MDAEIVKFAENRPHRKLKAKAGLFKGRSRSRPFAAKRLPRQAAVPTPQRGSPS